MNYKNIPDNVVLHGLKQRNGKFIVRIFGVNDNPKENRLLNLWESHIQKKIYIPDAYQYRTPTDGALPCGQDGISGITVHGWLWHDIL